MKFYDDVIGRVVEIPDKDLVHSFWAWKKGKSFKSHTPLERIFLAYMMERGAGKTWEPVPYREVYILLLADHMKRRHDEDVELETECEDCGRPLDMCECGLCPGGA